MRFIFGILLAFVALIALSSAYPAEFENVDELVDDEKGQPPAQKVEEELVRHKRATCDLLSGLGWNHAPCAARCVVINRKSGGYCNGSGVCVCR